MEENIKRKDWDEIRPKNNLQWKWQWFKDFYFLKCMRTKECPHSVCKTRLCVCMCIDIFLKCILLWKVESVTASSIFFWGMKEWATAGNMWRKIILIFWFGNISGVWGYMLQIKFENNHSGLNIRNILPVPLKTSNRVWNEQKICLTVSALVHK